MPALRGILRPEGALIDVQLGWSDFHARQLQQNLRPVPPAIDAQAIVDTGAEITCIDGSLVRQLGLPLAQLALANVPALGGLRVGAHYHAGLELVHPSQTSNLNLVITNLLVMEVPLVGLGYQVLLGRDMLARCDFVYGGRRQRFSLIY